jgi:hypothetical protein
MMEAVRTSETSADNHFTRQYNPEDSSEQDLSFFAERTANMNVGFVSLLMRHDKPWVDGRVRGVNL